VRPLILTAKLKDTANTSEPELSFQRKAVQDYHSRQTEVSQPSTSQQAGNNDPPSLILDTGTHMHTHVPDTTSTPQAKRPFSSITTGSDNETEDASIQPEQRMFFFASLKLIFLLALPSFTAQKRCATGSSSQDKRNNLDLEDTDDIRKKGMNCLISLTNTDES
jgi:hypothetical protein